MIFYFILISLGALHARTVPVQDGAPLSIHYVKTVSTVQFRLSGQTALNQTFTINSPGVYSFVQDIGHQNITTTGTAAGVYSAVYVNSSNVIIDLGGRTLYQANDTPNINGIEIAPGVHNVVIKNGNIADFNGYGILVREGTDNIRIEGLTISHTGNCGIYFQGTSAAPVKNSVINNTIVSIVEGVSTSPYALPNSTLLTSLPIPPSGATSSSTSVTSLPLVNCTTLFYAGALHIIYGKNITITNSIFSGNQPAATSMYVSGKTTPPDTGAFSYGVLLEYCSNINCDMCDASNNTGNIAIGFGVVNNCTSCNFDACTAHNNNGLDKTNGIGGGFFVDSSSGIVFRKCLTSSNSGLLFGAGFRLNNTTAVNIENSQSFYNTGGLAGSGVSSGGYGFFSTLGQGNIFESCVTGCNQGDPTVASVLGAGFLLQAELKTHISRSQSIANGASNALSFAAGIYMLKGCSQCVVQGNKLYNSVSKTTGSAYGLFDDAGPSTSLITDCIAFGNASIDGAARNYVVNYARSDEAFYTNAATSVGTLKDIASISPFQNISIIGK